MSTDQATLENVVDIWRSSRIVIPFKKRLTISTRSDKKSKASLSSTSSASTKTTAKHDLIREEEDKLCVISGVEECKQSGPFSSTEVKQSPTPPLEPPVKVPIFVLHPSGTHYIPMSVDASIVSHAFTKKSSYSRSTSSSSLASEPIQCHPVSIPVNFNPINTLSDPYELDIQNINVIGTRHQTSVRPNWLASNIVLFPQHRFSTHLQVYTCICHPCSIDSFVVRRDEKEGKRDVYCDLRKEREQNDAVCVLYSPQIGSSRSSTEYLFLFAGDNRVTNVTSRRDSQHTME